MSGDLRADALFAELLLRGRRATLRARGGSMWPALRDGDVLTLAPARELRRGDLLAVRCGEALVVHRAIRVASGEVILRGDALPRNDGSFPAEAVLGRVVAIRRGSRTLRPGRGTFAFAARLWLRLSRRLAALLARAGRSPIRDAGPATGTRGHAASARAA